MTIQLDELIESEDLGRYQSLILLLVSMAIIVDGFDIQMIAFVSPVLIEQWGISKADIAIAVSAAFVGMATGAPIGGWIGDNWGRRHAIVTSVIFFGATTIPAAFASDITELAVIRFISGLGFGALLPNATALLAEWMPGKVRSYAISLMIVGVPVGGMMGAASSNWLIAAYGWQSCFIAGGALALSVGVLLFFCLPESPKYLARNSDNGGAAGPVLVKAFGHDRIGTNAHFTVSEGIRANWADIFTSGHRRVTIGLSIAFLASLMVFYGFVNWFPTVLTSRGLPLDTALRASMFFNLSGLAGAIGAAAIVSRLGSRRGLMLLIAGGMAASASLALVLRADTLDPIRVMTAMAVAGAFLAGLQVALYSLAAGAYPTGCRSTGVGFAAGTGRLGPIISAFGGGLLLEYALGIELFFITALVVLTIAAIGILLVDRHTPPFK